VRRPVNVLFAWIAAAALQAAVPMAAAAEDPAPELAEVRNPQDTENRWVASLAVTSGVLLQGQDGSINSCLFANPANATGECPAPGSTPLRPSTSDHDLAIVAFVGGNLELMSPALPIPTRPRLFVSGEFLPIFSADRDVAGEGDPGCVRGPEPSDDNVCASDQDPNNPRSSPYGEQDARGVGSRVTTTYDTLSFGANVGVAFPARAGERRLRIKPSVGWLSYKAELTGVLTDATCRALPPPPAGATQCTNAANGSMGALRETSLGGRDSRRFHGVGPGLDVEMDTGRFGPLGTSLYLGGRAYRTFGNRTLEVQTMEVYPMDGLPLAGQAVSGEWEVEMKPWIYRLGVGLRLQWLGSRQ
jgi:hypothetical protein